LSDPAIAGQRQQAAMKALIAHDPGGGVRGGPGLDHVRNRPAQRREFFFPGLAHGGQHDRLDFQGGDGLVDIPEVGQGDLGYPRPLARHDLHEAFDPQALDRLAHRGATQAQVRGDLAIVDRLAARQAIGHDPALEPAIGFFDQRAGTAWRIKVLARHRNRASFSRSAAKTPSAFRTSACHRRLRQRPTHRRGDLGRGRLPADIPRQDTPLAHDLVHGLLDPLRRFAQ
jgi:hypothetical protein